MFSLAALLPRFLCAQVLLPLAVSKGCFLKDAEVTMADGTRKQLHQIRVGDQVTSWDEATQRRAASTVQATPAYWRGRAELVEVRLPHASVHATKDHPFWSRSRQGLVSFDPAGTHDAYQLSAELMEAGEVLEDERQGSVGVVAVHRPPTHNRTLRALRAAADDRVEVMTLCLSPHHWYFVHGVRVHNKGCFMKDAEVTLADGSRKQLGHIQVGDQVTSWDDDLGKTAMSTVQAVPTYQRDVAELIEVSLPSASFLVTEDHPFWSRGRRGLVSFNPSATEKGYQLNAELLAEGELLEGERQEVVGVTSIRPGSSAVLGNAARRLGSTAEVATLCLSPHHWFYVHGVRVHNKGCFVGTTAITLADGSRKQLQDIRVGDRVASWDEAARRAAPSTVQAVPTFQRESSDLAELSLPHSVLRATTDHPFWSKRRQGLVSVRPGSTRDLYGLEAGPMSAGEELEDERQAGVVLAGVRGLGNWTRHASVEVMTLCLAPHHWFYAQGVRVHNKGGGGCFAPWTPVLMSDGAQKRISDVRADDWVVSWDADAGNLTASRVVAVEVFPAPRLLEIAFNHTLPAGGGGAPMAPNAATQFGQQEWHKGAEGRRHEAVLVVTEDHPVYSARHGGLVSMLPELTHERYGLRVGQMRSSELLHHHLGHTPEAEVRPWLGGAPSEVMTLRLEQHHWFYVHGVRVHNKGSSGGGGFGGTTMKSYRRGAFATPFLFAGFIILHGGSRRRYGTYNDEGDCRMHSQPVVENACRDTIGEEGAGSQDRCYRCLDCETEQCISDIGECDDFMASAFETCDVEEEEDGGLAILFGIFVFVGITVCCCGCIFLKHKKKRNNSAKLQEMLSRREHMGGDNGRGLDNRQFSGTYSEKGETKPTRYTFQFNGQGGYFTGSSCDDDGTAQINGKMDWPAYAQEGDIRWQEVYTGWTMEVEGRINDNGINANYMSSNGGTVGTISLASQMPVQVGTVIGVPQAENVAVGSPVQPFLKNYAAKE